LSCLEADSGAYAYLCSTRSILLAGPWYSRLLVLFVRSLTLPIGSINTPQFAAANLKTALTVIRTNFGLVLLAYGLEVVAFAWTVLWIDAAGANMSSHGFQIVFLYLLSFFWTHQVMNNLQHMIVASVLGTWWYTPSDANSFWDDGLSAALCHSLTFSLGSISLGSLLAGIAQALQWTHRWTASQSNRCGKCVTAMIDCILSCK
jgi:hypothetical protein